MSASEERSSGLSYSMKPGWKAEVRSQGSEIGSQISEVGRGKKQKTPMFTEDYSEALTFAEYDIQSNWRIYKQHFLEGA